MKYVKCFVFCWFRGLIRLGFGKIARCGGGSGGGYVLEVVQTRNVKMIVYIWMHGG